MFNTRMFWDKFEEGASSDKKAPFITDCYNLINILLLCFGVSYSLIYLIYDYLYLCILLGR